MVTITKIILLMFFLSSSVLIASTEQDGSSFKKTEASYNKEDVLQSISAELVSIKKQLAKNSEKTGLSINKVDEKSQLEVLTLRHELEEIGTLLSNYDHELSNLKKEGVNKSLDMNFSVWTGILLTCVAVIVTTLGVVIAIGSVFGYKKIMDSSRQEAERIATLEANKVAKEEVAKRINNGEFNALVIEAVDRVAFGNINSNTSLDDRMERDV